MQNETLNEVVERLFDDRRFLRRFRRNPERALRTSGLGAREIGALKRGDTTELLELGVRPEIVWPELRPTASLSGWLLQSRRKLAPAALLLALAAAAPAQATAARTSLAHRDRRASHRFVAHRAVRVVGRRAHGLRVARAARARALARARMTASQ